MLTWPAGALGMARGTEKTVARVRSSDEQSTIVVLDRLGAEDAGADDRADACGIGVGHDDAGLTQRFAGRDHRDQAETVHRHQTAAVEADIRYLLDFGADADLQLVQRRDGDRADRRTASDQRLPDRGNVNAEPAYAAKARDDDTWKGHISPWPRSGRV